MPPKEKKKDDEEEQLTRIAIVDDQKCKPKKCAQECQKFCPVVRMGEEVRMLTDFAPSRSLVAGRAFLGCVLNVIFHHRHCSHASICAIWRMDFVVFLNYGIPGCDGKAWRYACKACDLSAAWRFQKHAADCLHFMARLVISRPLSFSLVLLDARDDA
jgi:hypothetical protein